MRRSSDGNNAPRDEMIAIGLCESAAADNIFVRHLYQHIPERGTLTPKLRHEILSHESRV